jgi:hypothetical protein
MYAHCLFCAADLGRNEVVEHFPVGRRLAFDAARGRLWVVCRKCLRWNLTPLEERWEAIEECERLFRDTPLRTSTDNVGLAKVREGLELVRIGRPERPEFAAWRYGETFVRRRTRVVVAAVGVAAVGGIALATGAFTLLKAVVPGGGLLYQLPNWYNIYRMTLKPVARIPSESGPTYVLRGKHAPLAELVRSPDGADWALQVEHEGGTSRLAGAHAYDVAARLLARFNHAGGSRAQVGDAVRRIEESGTPERLLRGAAGAGTPLPRPKRSVTRFGHHFEWSSGTSYYNAPPDALCRVPSVDRLALEMAVHEASERRALEGELGALEARWKEAEEIAAIADELTLPGTVTRALSRLKGEK